jgi:predicted enzyme related to lactoylglutathione lyase
VVAQAAILTGNIPRLLDDVQSWGFFVTFSDPDGNTWTLQQLPARE